jgi:peptidyl-tRNA hydrolase ICT1
LFSILPRALFDAVRESRYYTSGNDSITIKSQTQRSRSANASENRQKLFDEIQELYRKKIPGETSPEKEKKHEAL